MNWFTYKHTNNKRYNRCIGFKILIIFEILLDQVKASLHSIFEVSLEKLVIKKNRMKIVPHIFSLRCSVFPTVNPKKWNLFCFLHYFLNVRHYTYPVFIQRINRTWVRINRITFYNTCRFVGYLCCSYQGLWSALNYLTFPCIFKSCFISLLLQLFLFFNHFLII